MPGHRRKRHKPSKQPATAAPTTVRADKKVAENSPSLLQRAWQIPKFLWQTVCQIPKNIWVGLTLALTAFYLSLNGQLSTARERVNSLSKANEDMAMRSMHCSYNLTVMNSSYHAIAAKLATTQTDLIKIDAQLAKALEKIKALEKCQSAQKQLDDKLTACETKQTDNQKTMEKQALELQAKSAELNKLGSERNLYYHGQKSAEVVRDMYFNQTNTVSQMYWNAAMMQRNTSSQLNSCQKNLNSVAKDLDRIYKCWQSKLNETECAALADAYDHLADEKNPAPPTAHF